MFGQANSWQTDGGTAEPDPLNVIIIIMGLLAGYSIPLLTCGFFEHNGMLTHHPINIPLKLVPIKIVGCYFNGIYVKELSSDIWGMSVLYM